MAQQYQSYGENGVSNGKSKGDNNSMSSDFDTLKDDLANLKEQLATLTGHAAKATANTANDLGRRANATYGQVMNHVSEHPLTSVALAFGLGCLVSRLIRSGKSISKS